MNAGEVYGDGALPVASNDAANALSATGSYEGNVILIGTEANPIELNGQIAVDGDLIIKGPVKGTGQFFVSRNIYFVGDTTYADAPDAVGKAADGSQNLVAYAAGGNIMIGDYLSPKKIEASPAAGGGGKKPKGGGGSDLDVAAPEYLTAAGIDPGGPPNSGVGSSFTMSEVTLFNKMEYNKAQADPSYTPRYYQLRDGDPIYRFTGDKEHGDKYDADFMAFEPQAGSAIVSLAPQDEWVSELFLKKIWQDDDLARPDTGRPFQLDGLFYTNNSIMALARSKGKHNSNTYGQLLVRGGLIAADIGIFSAGEKDSNRRFTMHYDKRVADFLGIKDVSSLGLERGYRVFQ